MINYNYISDIAAIIRAGVDVDDFADSFSKTQLVSKKWLVDVLCDLQEKTTLSSPSILILGGWYGSYLVPMLRERLFPSHIYFNDIDHDRLRVAKSLHAGEGISFHQFDATKTIPKFDVDVVINTSCEHMSSYDQMMQIDKDPLFVLQTCDNKNDPGHINTSSSTQDFLAKLQLSRVVFTARRDMGHKNRFLVIGKR